MGVMAALTDTTELNDTVYLVHPPGFELSSLGSTSRDTEFSHYAKQVLQISVEILGYLLEFLKTAGFTFGSSNAGFATAGCPSFAGISTAGCFSTLPTLISLVAWVSILPVGFGRDPSSSCLCVTWRTELSLSSRLLTVVHKPPHRNMIGGVNCLLCHIVSKQFQTLLFSSTQAFSFFLNTSIFPTFLNSAERLLKLIVSLFIKLFSVNSSLLLKSSPILTESD